MSSPAPFAPAKVTNGYAQIPNSLIENQALLTRAELALALIVLRRGRDAAIPVSDTNWQSWTGLKPRMKEAAAAGLREKCLRITGRGDTAQYAFDFRVWETFVRRSDRTEKPRTVGRAVDPKPGAKVHQECRDKGCQMLCETGLNCKSPFVVTPIAQPVAQTPPQNGMDADSKNSQKRKSPFVVTPIAQPVAQTPPQSELNPADFPQTLTAIRASFPLVGDVFVGRLLQAVAPGYGSVADVELAEAVGMAWAANHKKQRTEGLFLATVPEALAVLRRSQRRKPGAELPLESLAVTTRNLLAAVRSRVGELGEPFAEVAGRLEGFALQVNEDWDWHAVREGLEDLENSTAEVVLRFLPAEQAGAIKARVSATLQEYRARMSGDQFGALVDQAFRRESFAALQIPRIILG